MIEGQEGLTWERWRRLCHDVEALGFDSLWRSDHFYSVMGVPGRECIETWVSLALAAEWTTRVEFGALVSSMTFRHPALLARMAASVDQLSGGRLVVGVGGGWYQQEHERFGIPFPDTRTRLDRLEQGIARMRQTWAEALPRPIRDPVPLIVGGTGEKRTLRIVAREASEWNCNQPSLETYRAKAQVLAAYCREIGRDPGSIRHSLMNAFLIGRNEDELRGRAALVGKVVPRFGEASPDRILEQVRGRWFVGTPPAVVQQISTYAEAGVSRFMLQHFLMDDVDALQLLAQEVLPALARTAAPTPGH